MNKEDFKLLYDKTIKVLADKFIIDNPSYSFSDNLSGLYEEYMNEKLMMHWIYGKENELLDRHKICACMTVAIIKMRLLSNDLSSDGEYSIESANCANEQLAFLTSWELLKAFIITKEKGSEQCFELPKTFHNLTFEETVTRSLFLANRLNGLSSPLIANMYFLLERYCLDTKEKA